MPKYTELSGQRFGRLTVIERGLRQSHWLCLCDCGNRKEVRSAHLRNEAVKSCGCLSAEASSARLLARDTPIGLKHGASSTRAYQTWLAMHQRCSNPRNHAFKDYGGRGIKVCDRWSLFENFLTDMGQPPDKFTLDRKDNNSGYEPDNCRWATRKQQMENRRNNRLITINGVTKVASQWAAETGINRNTIIGRVNSGLTGRDLIRKR